jgi:hypothetical protein
MHLWLVHPARRSYPNLVRVVGKECYFLLITIASASNYDQYSLLSSVVASSSNIMGKQDVQPSFELLVSAIFLTKTH